ncbi:MAG: GIY-YIG nuclease family protein [Verrucomicrobia bacterium]|nr:GIY-YIG nuclease family protein [Verrucomicrobiota bacterium]
MLHSVSHNRLYKGACENVKMRLDRHNDGYVKSTKPYRPWRLIYTEQYATRSDALHRERFWKTRRGAKALRDLLSEKGLIE